MRNNNNNNNNTSHFLQRVCCGKLPDPNKFTRASAAKSTIIRRTSHSGIVLFSVQNLLFKTRIEYSETHVHLWGSTTSTKSRLAFLLGAGANAGACALFGALLGISSTGGISHTSTPPGALDRAGDISALWQMIVGSPFNLGHLYFQARFPWLLLWYWRCPRVPSTCSTSHTGALHSSLGRWCLGQ